MRNITLENVYNIVYTKINIIYIDVLIYLTIDLDISTELGGENLWHADAVDAVQRSQLLVVKIQKKMKKKAISKI